MSDHYLVVVVDVVVVVVVVVDVVAEIVVEKCLSCLLYTSRCV